MKTPVDSQVTVEVVISDCINYASYQNSVPVIQKLSIRNDSPVTISNVQLLIRTSPGFARPRKWQIDRIQSQATVSIDDTQFELDPEYLGVLDESERGELLVELLCQNQVYSQYNLPIRVLSRDEWGGLGGMASLLAAFVMPNDPAIPALQRATSEVLERGRFSPALDGYQSGDPQRVYMLAASAWSAVAALRLTYANPPSSFELSGQKIRRPAMIMQDRLATCLDSTLLFASLLEAIGLNTVAVFRDGHCFVGVWLKQRMLNMQVEEDPMEVRKAIAAKELIVFETTMVTHRPAAPFDVACQTAERSMQRSHDETFAVAVDIARCRIAEVKPLAAHARYTDGKVEEPADSIAPVPLPAMPDFSMVQIEETEIKPVTPQGRIERWRRKLLDLSARNRLLNFRETKQSIPFLCPNVRVLSDKLAAGEKLRIISANPARIVGLRDEKTFQRSEHQELMNSFAVNALDRNELACTLKDDDVSARLIELFRKQKNDLAEGGSNTLFLAIGFLRWIRPGATNEKQGKGHLAPLLLLPARLVRATAASPFVLESHEDEVRFNATLIQMLKQDFSCDIGSLETALPTDENGVNVLRVLQQVRKAIQEMPGFEVIEEATLGIFSFAKYLMWKDLSDRLEALKNNRVVRHLIENPTQRFQAGVKTPISDVEQLDDKFAPGDLVCPLPADSSQLKAVAAADAGHDFVLIGPPGTGKSQTISNIIAHCLARRKSVLFVAEKTAALDVVSRRLKERGLGKFCFELHSNRTDRRQFISSLNAAWTATAEDADFDAERTCRQLKQRRDHLNAYVRALHTRNDNGWTVFRALGEASKGAGRKTPKLRWPAATVHSQEAYDAFMEAVGDLALNWSALGNCDAPKYLQQQEWSAGWEASLFSELEEIVASLEELQSHLSEFSNVIGGGAVAAFSPLMLDRFEGVAAQLLQTASGDFSIIFDRQFAQLSEHVDSLAKTISGCQFEIGRLSATYTDEDLMRVPVAELDTAWREAATRFWPLSWLAKRRVRLLLGTFTSGGTPLPETDLPTIGRIQLALQKLAADPMAKCVPDWAGRHTNPEVVRQHYSAAKRVRTAITQLAKLTGTIESLSLRLRPVLSNNSTEHAAVTSGVLFIRALRRYRESAQHLSKLLGAEVIHETCSDIVQHVLAMQRTLEQQRSSIRRWMSWRKSCRVADDLGLQPFAEALKTGTLAHQDARSAFVLSYVRWWLPGVLDRHDVLRQFQAFQHENLIQQYRDLDELIRQRSVNVVSVQRQHRLPPPSEVPRQSELGTLRHQAQLMRPSRTIRELIGGMPESFGQLAPCLLMSPISIAQYLPPEQAIFDVVIFDEASQITTWDAIGAIARGRQTIIVGDPKQLPPTNFFGRVEDESADDDIREHEQDLESILDEARSAGIPTIQLNWHYRSRHESLIAFSNFHYYNNELITFPSAVTNDRAVSLKYLPNGRYDRGKSCTNRQEALAIVADATGRMKRWMKLPQDQRQTLGVITFNSQQQALILDLFDAARRDSPEIEWYFDESRIEPVIVKNLENVQGDERDVMLFSIAYGPDAAGKMPLIFGALNRSGGERRLNVAVTRARRELVVYSSFKAEHLKAERAKHVAVTHLKTFLDYADRGTIALYAQTEGSVGGFESPFEQAVAERLSARGWQIVPQIGVSGFRIDLGVVNPDRPGAYLAGIECDGATYHRAATAQDRDKIREQILRNLGWEIVRVWSTDWWNDGDGATEALHSALSQLLEQDRATGLDSEETEETSFEETETPETEVSEGAEDSEPGMGSLVEYQMFDGSGFQIEPEQFTVAAYRKKLRQMIVAALQLESPIRSDVLVQRIAKLHGVIRISARTREYLLELFPDTDTTEESTGTFLWYPGPSLPYCDFRSATSETERRSLDQISVAELAGFVTSNRHLLEESDPALVLARRLGNARLSRSLRDRMMEAIHRATQVLGIDQES